MTLDELLDGLANRLKDLGELEGRFPYEPAMLGDAFPLVAVRYLNDTGDQSGSDEEFLPSRVSYVVRFYYPIFDTGDFSEDGLAVAQKKTQVARSTWTEDLMNDTSVGGFAYNTQIVGGRSFGVEDPDTGNLYCHEIILNAYIH